MKTTIYDVAKEANVSIATVSRVLNNSLSVSPETHSKVVAAMEKLNYQPSEIARGLVSNKMQTIGILTVDIRSPNYSVTAYTIERQLYLLGYNSILCNTFGGSEENINYARMLIDKGVSGIICIGSVFDRTFNETSLLSDYKSTPFVLTNYRMEAPNVSCIEIDEHAGMKLAIDNLIAGGCRNILFVKDMDSCSSGNKARSFRSILTDCGLTAGKSSIFETHRSLEGGASAVDTIIGSGVPFDAIIFNDDLTAIGGMKHLQSLGYSVPDDVSVTGYNNTNYAKCCTPSLTTIDNKFETVGLLAVTLLRDLIESGGSTSTINVVPQIIVRDSTRPALL